MKKIQSILIANRGEIASRIIRSCRKMGILSIAVFSDADRNALFVKQADRAVALGGNSPSESYLSIDKLLRAARLAGADAIHPGYGFLSENAEFARRCAAEGFTFIGPSPETIAAMGSKAEAKRLMRIAGVPVVPGYDGEDQSLAKLQIEANNIGYPVLLKAAAGGGGKGMRIVHDAADFSTAFISAKSEALNAFSDDRLIVEKYFTQVRHIEFQIFGDHFGNVIHLSERECTIQRRYQKVIEESPSPALDPDLRAAMGKAAVAVAKSQQYSNAGTVEFILTDSGDFYFLEVNTRLQVEHPVTEMVTGLDLVEMQIQVAEGKALHLAQTDVKCCGYAVECRLYAEDATKDFMPGAGQILDWHLPEVGGLRVDTSIESGSDVSSYYDPMLAKIIVWAEDRQDAHRKMAYALREMRCLGVVTNRKFLASVIQDPDFRNGNYDTHFLEKWSGIPSTSIAQIHEALIAVTLSRWSAREGDRKLLAAVPSGWRNSFSEMQFDVYNMDDRRVRLSYRYGAGFFGIELEGVRYDARIVSQQEHSICFEINGMQISATVLGDRNGFNWVQIGGNEWKIQEEPRFPILNSSQKNGDYLAPMPSQVLRILVKAGQCVEAGEGLVVLSSMKMENTLVATSAGIVTEIFVQEGQNVEAKVEILKMDPIQEVEK